MAVRHGYGKIAGVDALVFAYDTGDTKNSYKGEPTVNEIHTHYDVTFESLADGNTATFANQLGTGNYLGVSSTRGYNSSKSLRVNRGTGGTGRVYKTLGLTAGDSITVTAWVYSDVPGPYIHLEYFGGDYSWYVPYTKNSHQGTGWEKLYATANSSATSNTTLYYFFYPSVQNTDTYWDNVQVEKKSHPTPFVNGTRSATQGLLDLTGNNTIDLTDVSFDSNAQMTFDGTDDKAVVANFPHIWDGSVTLESIVSWNDDSRSIIFGNYNVGANDINFEKLGGRRMRFYWNRGERDVTTGNNVVTTTGDYHHITMVRDKAANVFRLYVNGVLLNTITNVGTDVTSTGSTFRIGGDTRDGATIHNGNIPVVKLYNRALTTAEVKNNYNNYKGRFNI